MARILIVDDEEMLRQLIAEELEDLGYEIIEAEDGIQALELLRVSKPDLVISDINMPNMDGFELLRTLQAETPELAAVPFIFLTALANRENIIQGKRLGVDDYLSKPIDYELLVATVEARLNSVIRSDLAIADKLKGFYEKFQQTDNKEEDPRNLSLDAFLEHYLKYANLAKRTLPSARLLNHASYSFKTREEAETIAFSLASVCPEPETAGVGLVELLLNAVEHGNLEIGYSSKTHHLEVGDLDSEIERRLGMPEYASRKVRVEFSREANRLVFTVRDEGKGFEWQQYKNFDPMRLTHKHGRGISMASSLCFSTLEYQGKGNTVVAAVKIEVNETE